MYSFPDLEPVCCSTSGSNCCFLTCVQFLWRQIRRSSIPISLRIFQCVAIHTVKGFSIVNEAEVDILLEFPCFLCDPVNVGNLISDYSAFSQHSLDIWKFSVHIMLKPSMQDFEHDLTSMGGELQPAQVLFLLTVYSFSITKNVINLISILTIW